MKHIFKIFILVLLFNSFSFAEIQVSEKVKNLLSKVPIEEFIKILRTNNNKQISSFLKMNGVEYDKLNNTVIIKRELLPSFKNVLKDFLKNNKISANKIDQAKLFAKILAYSTKWDMCRTNNIGTQAIAYYINKGYQFKYETIYNGKILTENLINNTTCKTVDKYNSLEEYIKDNF